MGFIAIVIDDAAIIKIRLNQRTENILQCCAIAKCFTRFNAPIPEAIYFDSLSMCTFQDRFWLICTPMDGFAVDFYVRRSRKLV